VDELFLMGKIFENKNRPAEMPQVEQSFEKHSRKPFNDVQKGQKCLGWKLMR